MGKLHKRERLLERFGSPAERIRLAVSEITRGGGVIIIDDESRENEGDMIFAAQTLTADQMALMIREGSGIVCLVLTDRHASALDLPPMVSKNSSRFGTSFTVSIEAQHGVTSGVSAADRVTTIHTAIADGACPDDLARPGHVFPLRSHPLGLMSRRGHTEATIALMELAGTKPAGVLCEVMNPDGTMAQLAELIEFSKRHTMPIVTIDDILAAMTDTHSENAKRILEPSSNI